MSKGLAFWIVFLIVVIFSGWWGITNFGIGSWLGGYGVIFILLGLLGWQTFGPPVK